MQEAIGRIGGRLFIWDCVDDRGRRSLVFVLLDVRLLTTPAPQTRELFQGIFANHIPTIDLEREEIL